MVAMFRTFGVFILGIAISVGLFPSHSHAKPPSPWKHVFTDEGITVTTREVPGRDLPTFRAIGIINADAYDILGVIYDIPRYPQWMGRCTESRLLKRINKTTFITYTVTDSPWPVSDRDAVYRAQIDVVGKAPEFLISFEATKIPSMPPRSGRVRMTYLKGHYRITSLGSSKTRVEYQVDADPGGYLPNWLIRMVARHVPFDTLVNLRARVVKTKGWYQRYYKEWKSIAAHRLQELFPEKKSKAEQK